MMDRCSVSPGTGNRPSQCCGTSAWCQQRTVGFLRWLSRRSSSPASRCYMSVLTIECFAGAVSLAPPGPIPFCVSWIAGATYSEA